jgi:ribosome maturation factor RimP
MIKIKDFDGRRIYVRLQDMDRTGKYRVGKVIGFDEESRFLILDLEKEGKTKHKVEAINLDMIERIVPLSANEDPQTLLM